MAENGGDREAQPHPFHIDGLLGLSRSSESEQVKTESNSSSTESSPRDRSSVASTISPEIPVASHFVYGVAAAGAACVAPPSPSLHCAMSLWNQPHVAVPTSLAVVSSKSIEIMHASFSTREPAAS